jgi:hypothetical protein
MVKTKRKSVQEEATAAPVLSLKERLAQRRKVEKIRKELITFTVVALLFCSVIGLVAGLAGGPKVGGGVTLALLCLSLSFKYPRQGLWFFLLYMPLGGTITYSLGNSPLLQLAKDGFYIPALFGVIQYCRREQLPLLIPKQMMAPLAIVLTFCILTLVFANGAQQLGPHGTDQPLAMGILGLKIFLGYVPLIVCSYYLIRDRKDLMTLMRLTVIVVLVCCGLAFIQYLMLKTGRCKGTQGVGSDLFKASLNARCFVGGSLLYSPEFNQIRLPGTFVAPWQWGWFLISAGFLAFAPAFNDPKPHWRTLGLASMAAAMMMAVLSGQRIALAIVPAAVALLLVLTGQIIYLKRFIPTAVGLSVLLGVLAVSNPQVLQERIDSFVSRWNASPPQEFIITQFEWSLNQQKGFFGNGLGRATNSARALGETRLIETYYPKVLYEIGPYGTFAFFVMVTSLTYATFKAFQSIRDTTLRPYAAALWLFVLFISYNTYYYPLDVDPVAVYYWFFAGVVLKIPEIQRQEKLEAAEKEKPLDKKKKKKGRLRRKGFG